MAEVNVCALATKTTPARCEYQIGSRHFSVAICIVDDPCIFRKKYEVSLFELWGSDVTNIKKEEEKETL